MKCLKSFRRGGSTFWKGKDYDVSPELAQSHEDYLGEKLFEGGKKKKVKVKNEDVPEVIEVRKRKTRKTK